MEGVTRKNWEVKRDRTCIIHGRQFEKFDVTKNIWERDKTGNLTIVKSKVTKYRCPGRYLGLVDQNISPGIDSGNRSDLIPDRGEISNILVNPDMTPNNGVD